MPDRPFLLSEDLVALAARVIRDNDGIAPAPADLLEQIGRLIEAGVSARAQTHLAGKVLGQFGLTPGEFNDMASVAKFAELEAEGGFGAGKHEGPAETWAAQAERLGWLYSTAARRVVIALYLRGMEGDVIARALDLPEDRVLATIQKRPGPHQHERAFVVAALQGTPTVTIAKQHEASYRTVERAIVRAGMKPIPLEDRRRQRATRQRIIALRNKGLSYPEIEEATGANTNQIRNALRAAQNKGILTYRPGAGRSPASVGRSPGADRMAA